LRVELEDKVSIEVIRLENRRRRLHAVNRPKRLGLAKGQHRAAALEGRFGTHLDIDQTSRARRGNGKLARDWHVGRPGTARRGGGGLFRTQAIDVGENGGEIRFALAARDREGYRLLECVRGAEQQLDHSVAGSLAAAAEMI